MDDEVKFLISLYLTGFLLGFWVSGVFYGPATSWVVERGVGMVNSRILSGNVSVEELCVDGGGVVRVMGRLPEDV